MTIATRAAAHATLAAACCLAIGCESPKGDAGASAAAPSPPAGTPSTPSTPSTPPTYREIPRQELNRLALEGGLPLFWMDDTNKDGKLDPNEVWLVWGVDGDDLGKWVANGAFTPAFSDAYVRLRDSRGKATATAGPEAQRRAAIIKELEQSYYTLLTSDFTNADAEDRAIVTHVLAAARIVERIFARQGGSFELDKLLAADDPASRFAFYLNQGPWCSGPATEADPSCSALPSKPPRLSGLYPTSLQADKGFCDKLAADPKGEELLSPFTVVVAGEGGALKTVPYHEAYKADMQAVAVELRAAAAAIKNDKEAAFKAYLEAAAKAFTDGSWFDADEAWAKMTAENSKWYLRIGPDEVYSEPCSRKSSFHVSFARIDEASAAWQKRVEPFKAQMEQTLAAMAGKPYKARTVAFRVPDFIDIIINAGDSRSARGATIGQSLPNFGPVAERGGRTVAMANFYTDVDSKATARAQAESMLCTEAMAAYDEQDQDAQVTGTVLHEAAHNLGPSQEYKVLGKTDSEIFGGPLASTLEELKAQTSALYLTDWLASKKGITQELAKKAHVRDLTWALGHISRGMRDPDGKPKPYSQLAAVQMGFFLDQGALTWSPEKTAANGKDKGCLDVDLGKLPGAIEKLERQVLGIKARGDVKGAGELIVRYVDAEGPWKQIMSTVAERYLRYPRASFLYSVRL